jgi:hypothetical protein
VLCAVTISSADLHSLSLYYYTVCGRMRMSSVLVWCSCLLVFLLVNCLSIVCMSYLHGHSGLSMIFNRCK